MANNKITTRNSKSSRILTQRRQSVPKPFWRIETAANEKTARTIEEEADRDYAAGSTSKLVYEGNREFARRIREGKSDVDYLFDSRMKGELPKITICKIRPDRIRRMDAPELARGLFFLGPVTKKERASKTSPRGLMYRLMSGLLGDRKYGDETAAAPNGVNHYQWSACWAEKEIYDAQQKKGCPISETDVAARDELRKQACDAPYPTEKLDKIRGRRKATIRGPKIK